MKQVNEVTCDNCNELFKIHKIKSKKVGVYKGNNVRFNYFDCAKCKSKYFVSVREKTLNKMMQKMKKLQKHIKLLIDVDDTERDIEKINEQQDQLRELQIEVKLMSDKLRAMFELK